MTSRRIAFLTPEYPSEFANAGGLSNYLRRTCKVLRDMGHRPEVFTLSKQPPETIEHEGITVHRVAPAKPAWLSMPLCMAKIHYKVSFLLTPSLSAMCGALGLARALRRAERSEPFDFVQASDFGLAGLFVDKRHDRPLLVRCSWSVDLFKKVDGTPSSRGERLVEKIERHSIRRADFAYAPSRFVADDLNQRFGMTVNVIRPPIVQEVQPEARGDASLPDRFLLHFGLMSDRKGTDVIAKALPIAWEQEPDLTMVWAGKELSPDYVAAYSKPWGERENQVHYLGPVDKPLIYGLLERTIAAVLPSRVDNLPNTVIESVLCGVPVVGSNGASIDELIEDQKNGLLVPVGDHEALAQAMVRAWRGELPGRIDDPYAAGCVADMQHERAGQHLIDTAMSLKSPAKRASSAAATPDTPAMQERST